MSSRFHGLGGKGFEGRRVALALAAANCCLVPVNLFVSCEMSGRVACMSLVLSLLTTVLCFLPPSRAVNHYFPIALTWGAALLTALGTH